MDLTLDHLVALAHEVKRYYATTSWRLAVGRATDAKRCITQTGSDLTARFGRERYRLLEE